MEAVARSTIRPGLIYNPRTSRFGIPPHKAARFIELFVNFPNTSIAELAAQAGIKYAIALRYVPATMFKRYNDEDTKLIVLQSAV